jgi:hypothetical protein
MPPLRAKGIRGRTGRGELTSSSQRRLRRRSRCTESSLKISRSPNESLQEEAANGRAERLWYSETVPWQRPWQQRAKQGAGPYNDESTYTPLTRPM